MSETIVETPAKPLLPPKLTSRSTSQLPDFSRSLGEYYYPLRGIGYAAAVVADMYVDGQKRKAKLAGVELDTDPVKQRVSQVEAGVFAGLTIGYAVRDGIDAMRHFRGALAAEQGKHPSKVGYGDMLRSQNPIIQKAVKRFALMQATRLLADGAFLKGLNWGLLAMAARVTMERTVFNQKTAYERMEDLFDNTQIYGFDIHVTGKISREFGNIVQQSQKDHRRAHWEHDVILHYAPLFEQMADATVHKEITMPDAVYMLGELMTKRLSLEQSLALFADIRENGLENIGKRVMDKQGGAAVEELPPETTKTEYVRNLMRSNLLSKDALTRGPRSFGEMAKANPQAVNQL